MHPSEPGLGIPGHPSIKVGRRKLLPPRSHRHSLPVSPASNQTKHRPNTREASSPALPQSTSKTHRELLANVPVRFKGSWTTSPFSGMVVRSACPWKAPGKSLPSPGMELTAVPPHSPPRHKLYSRPGVCSHDLAIPCLNICPREWEDLQEIFAHLCSQATNGGRNPIAHQQVHAYKIVVCPCHGLLCSLKKEGSSGTCCHMGET